MPMQMNQNACRLELHVNTLPPIPWRMRMAIPACLSMPLSVRGKALDPASCLTLKCCFSSWLIGTDPNRSFGPHFSICESGVRCVTRFMKQTRTKERQNRRTTRHQMFSRTEHNKSERSRMEQNRTEQTALLAYKHNNSEVQVNISPRQVLWLALQTKLPQT